MSIGEWRMMEVASLCHFLKKLRIDPIPQFFISHSSFDIPKAPSFDIRHSTFVILITMP